MLREQFDIIIGNPPWLSYRYIADPEYQAEIKRRAVERYAIAPIGHKSLFTQMELAVVFLAHTMATFARPAARLGFLMPRSILSADQHQRLIRRQYLAPMRLTSYWDMWDVKPLFNVPSCVLFAIRDKLRGSSTDALPAQRLRGTLPERDVPWSTAKAKLVVESAQAHVIYLGSRCALSMDEGARTPGRAGAYSKIFKQGATIVPRSFYFVLVRDLNSEPDVNAQY
jgi:methylase of polypeptide subunit release factors